MLISFLKFRKKSNFSQVFKTRNGKEILNLGIEKLSLKYFRNSKEIIVTNFI